MLTDFGDRKVQRYLTLAMALSFLLLTVGILSVYSNPGTGYERSVYQSTPVIFWVAIITCLIVGVLVFHANYGTGRKAWVLGLFEILLAHVVPLTIFLYQGFIYIDRFDSQSYVGYARDITIYGHFYVSNFYPAISILTATTSEVIGRSVVIMSQVLPAFFLTLYSIGMLCWARSISNQPRFVAAMVLASVPILFAWFVSTIFHQTLMVLMLPLFFFILWKGRNGDPRLKVLAALMIALLVIGHMLVAMGALVFLVIIVITERLARAPNRTIYAHFIIFALVAVLGWIIFNAAMVNGMKAVVEQMLGMIEGSSTMGNAQMVASRIGLMATIQSILVCTVDDVIYVLLTMWGGLLILRGRWRGHPMTVAMTCFLGGILFLGVLMVSTFAHNPTRMVNLNFVMIFTVPMVGYLLYIKRSAGKSWKARLITVLILFCLVSTTLTIYQDPMEKVSNTSTTRSEYSGMGWFFTVRGGEINMYLLQTNPWRYADFRQGAVYVVDNPDLVNSIQATTDHFDSFIKANRTSATDYLIFTKFDKEAYTKVWVDLDRVTEDDFRRLDVSTSVNHVYENTGMSIYVRA
jgi:hypothetical protein